jgi:CRP-like cAMP-binding protein
MTLDLLFANISKHILLTEVEKNYFHSKLLFRKLKKKEIYIQENQVCESAAFVLSGCLRSYTIDDNGFEHILQFAPSDWWITDMFSFISQKPGTIYIDAIEVSEIILLSRADQLDIFEKIPGFERYFRILTENSLVSYRKRVIDGLSLTAIERYHDFCKRYPTLIERLPQKQIASYIGVTPEFLSKIRSNVKIM